MKKLLFLLLVFNTVNSQVKWNDMVYTQISIIVDPTSSVKEKGLNIGAEINYTQNSIYIHTGVQSFSKLEGNYLDWTTAGGIVLKYNDFRFYSGGRLGIILRDKSPFPTFGIEAGTDLVINRFVIGLRATEDYRSDFRYSGAEPGFRFSGFVKIGIKLWKI